MNESCSCTYIMGISYQWLLLNEVEAVETELLNEVEAVETKLLVSA